MTTSTNLRTLLITTSNAIARRYGYSSLAAAQKDCPSFLALETDQYGWGDGESPIIMWEEGPFEWALEVTANDLLDELLGKEGFYAEPINSWALGIYPL